MQLEPQWQEKICTAPKAIASALQWKLLHQQFSEARLAKPMRTTLLVRLRWLLWTLQLYFLELIAVVLWRAA